MALRLLGASAGRPARRGRRVALIAALIATCSTGCSVSADSAVLVSGTAVPASTVQEGTNAFLAQNPTAPATDMNKSLYNRAQITFRIRHALIDPFQHYAGRHADVPRVPGVVAVAEAILGSSSERAG